MLGGIEIAAPERNSSRTGQHQRQRSRMSRGFGRLDRLAYAIRRLIRIAVQPERPAPGRRSIGNADRSPAGSSPAGNADRIPVSGFELGARAGQITRKLQGHSERGMRERLDRKIIGSLGEGVATLGRIRARS